LPCARGSGFGAGPRAHPRKLHKRPSPHHFCANTAQIALGGGDAAAHTARTSGEGLREGSPPTSRKEAKMDNCDALHGHDDLFSIEQLEARFEMLAVPPPGGGALHTDWSCTFTFKSN
jgi:hypothetical protein